MKTILALLMVVILSFSQDDFFYVGMGIQNFKQTSEVNGGLNYDFDRNPYYFLGYNLTNYSNHFFEFGYSLGADYMILQNEYNGSLGVENDKYSLVYFHAIPRLTLRISPNLYINAEGKAQLKIVEFFINRRQNNVVTDELNHIDEFNSFLASAQASIGYSSDLLRGGRLQFGVMHSFGPWAETKYVKLESETIFTLTFLLPI